MSRNGIGYELIISKVREKLGCGADRICDAPSILRWSWWPSEPNIEDKLLSDYGVETQFSALATEFSDEIQAIYDTLEELSHEPKLADWQKSSIGEVRRMMKYLNQVGAAHGIWDRIAVPVRRRGAVIFRIWAPQDVMGAPIIKGLPIDVYVSGVLGQTASDRFEIARLKRKLEKWQTAAVVLAILVASIVTGWILWGFGRT